MPRAGKFLADPRQRLIALLGVVALAGIISAGIALSTQNSRTAPDSSQQLFFPGLADRLRQVVRIHIQSRSEAFDILFNPQKGWVLPERGDYPASLEQVRQTLVGLSHLEIIEPKTSRKDWLSYLGLDSPAHGKGLGITIFGNGNEKFASVIMGKTSDIGDKNGAVGLFVRRPDSHESWLVRSTFVPRASLVEWMDKNVLSIPRDRIRSVEVEPEGSAAFQLARSSKTQQDFALSPIPPGRRQAEPQNAFNIADALADFPFDNISPASEIDFSKAHRMVFRTFDGLMVTVLAVKRGGEYWASLEANPIPGVPGAEKEVRKISAHSNGWAYKLPSYKGEQLMPTLEGLLKPKASPK